MTKSCDGDQSVALLLTLITNCLGIVTVPLAIQYFVYSSSSVSFQYSDVFTKLCITVLCPSVLGVLLRARFRAVANFSKSHKVSLSLFSTFNLVCIIWQTLSSSASLIRQQSAERILLVIFTSSLLHLTFLGMMYILTSRLFMPLKATERVALMIMCAQKSPAVAVTIIAFITDSTAEQGLLSVPALLGQLAQIFIDSFLVRYLKRMVSYERTANLKSLMLVYPSSS